MYDNASINYLMSPLNRDETGRSNDFICKTHAHPHLIAVIIQYHWMNIVLLFSE